LKSSWTHLITPSRKFVECGDGLSFKVPPLASDALLTTLHALLESFRRIVEQAVLGPLTFQTALVVAPQS
jgi:hypothetical protein